MSERRKRLIEVALPLEEVSAHSRREKNVRHGHISTLHTWWARRPLAACRAFIYASLVDDPDTEAEREALLHEVADLASWDAVRHPEMPPAKADPNARYGGTGFTGTELLERARERILRDNGGEPPRLLDPFAGGGAIPLEGLRLGCEVEASDLNPVAVLILKGTLEYPQKFGQPHSRSVPDYIREADSEGAQSFAGGELAEQYRRNPLATDVRYWAHWVLERAREELAEFYPPDADGSVPVAYLWSRTIPCPSCRAEMPLIRQYWLARKERKRVALEPTIDREGGRVDFRVVEGSDVRGSPEQATTSRGDTRCLLCGQIAKGADTRQLSMEGKLGAAMTAVVQSGRDRGGKTYRADNEADWMSYQAAAERLRFLESSHTEDDLPLVPDEPIDPKTLGLRVDAFGFDTWGKLFNERQLLALTTLARLVGEARTAMREREVGEEYASVIATYLGLSLSRYTEFACTLARWKVDAEAVVGALARQALPMVWDYAEHVAVGTAGGSFQAMADRVAGAIEVANVSEHHAEVSQADARGVLSSGVGLVLTDPPYYDAIDYAGLSDFFYVWLKRAVGSQSPDLLQLPLSPKSQQAIMASESDDPAERQRYVSMMAQAFEAIASSLRPGGVTGAVFAHTNPDAWSTLIEGLLEADLVPTTSWPIDTEMETKTMGAGQARLRTSVWMACRKREEKAGEAFLGDVLEEMRPVIRDRLLYFWSQSIRGADFFISAIGPALSVYGHHRRVLRPDGTEVSVREFLDIVRRESTTVALEQVLHGADLGMVDPLTRQYVTWVWSYGRAPLDSGEALALCLATGVLLDEVTREHSLALTAKEKSKKVVKLRPIAQRAREDEDLGQRTAARPAPLIDELQRAAWLWSQNQTDRLAAYRGSLGEARWAALQTLGQAVAACLPDGDEDRRIILGLLGATVRESTTQPTEGEQGQLEGVRTTGT